MSYSEFERINARHLFVCDSFVHQGEQVIGEERCMGIQESNALWFVNICHYLLTHTHTHSENLNCCDYKVIRLESQLHLKVLNQ